MSSALKIFRIQLLLTTFTYCHHHPLPYLSPLHAYCSFYNLFPPSSWRNHFKWSEIITFRLKMKVLWKAYKMLHYLHSYLPFYLIAYYFPSCLLYSSHVDLFAFPQIFQACFHLKTFLLAVLYLECSSLNYPSPPSNICSSVTFQVISFLLRATTYSWAPSQRDIWGLKSSLSTWHTVDTQ